MRPAIGWWVGRAPAVALALGLVAAETVGGGAPPPGLAGHGGPVRAVLPLAADTVVTAGFDSAIIVWDVAAGAARRVLRFHDSTVNALAALSGDCFASAGEDSRIAVWCGTAAAPQRRLEGHSGPVVALAVSADGRRLASASWDRQVRVWDLAEPGHAALVVDGFAGPVNAVSFLADGSGLVAGSYDGEVRVTRFDRGRAALTRQLAAPVNAVLATASGDILAASADGRVRRFGAGLEDKGELALEVGPLTTLALSADGATLATAGMRTPVTLIDPATLKQRQEILGPGLPVWSLAFSRDGRELYTGGADRAVRRWDAATGRPAGADVAKAEEPAREGEQKRGAQVYRACRACHGLKPEDTNRAGPTFHGLFGRRIATAPGYAFSDALKGMDIVWTPETVSKLFEVGPNAYTPGTKMPEQRITDPADRQALVEWLAEVTEPAPRR